MITGDPPLLWLVNLVFQFGGQSLPQRGMAFHKTCNVAQILDPITLTARFVTPRQDFPV
jgi:hypothetical protein